MKKLLTTAAIGALFTAGIAVAAPQTAPADPAPRAAPAKSVSKADMLARAEARFDRLDVNKDGKLTPEERTAGRGGKMRGAKSDATITKADYRAMAEARFTRMDTNKDGQIERGERRGGMGKHRGHHGGKKFGWGGPRAGMMAGMMGADADKDGVITRAEFDAHNAARFARMDANKDGKIDASERRGPRGKMHGGRGGKAPAAAAAPVTTK